LLADPLFKPFKNFPGVSKLYWISAKETTQATITLTTVGGVITFKPLEEGLITNGVLDGISGNLQTGYAMKLLASPATAGKYISKFFLGTYRGYDTDNSVYYLNPPATSIPNNFLYTPDLASPLDLYNWMLSSSAFQSMFGSPTYTARKKIATSSLAVGGTGYAIGNTFTVNTGTTLATGTVTGVSSGIVTTYTLNTFGAGYVVASAVATTATSGSGTGLTINVLTVAENDFVAGDLVSNPTFVLAAGATETYNSTHLTEALASIGTLDNSFILLDDYGADTTSANNAAILDWVENTSKFERILFVGAGADKDTFKGTDPQDSEEIAEFYDNDLVVPCHGNPKKKKFASSGFNIYNSLYKAAVVLGRLAGLAPQDSVTFKGINIDGEVHSLLFPEEYEFALDKGILATVYDDELGIFCPLQGINSLQDNDNVLNPDATTFSIQLKRIEVQMNRDMAYNSKRDLFGDQMHGPNRKTISEADVIAFMTKFLKQKMTDGLIVKFGNLSAELVGIDTFKGNYDFVPNYEVTKLITTGTMLAS
jgi:hypothetical protein